MCKGPEEAREDLQVLPSRTTGGTSSQVRQLPGVRELPPLGQGSLLGPAPPALGS